MRRRGSAYREKAQYYERLEKLMSEGGFETPKNEAEAQRFGQLRAKYDRAANYPWLSVVPDPPDEIRRQEQMRSFLMSHPTRRFNGIGDR